MLIAQEVFRALVDVRFAPERMVQVDIKGHDYTFAALAVNFQDIGAFVETFLAA